MTVIVFRMYKVSNVSSIKQALEIIRKLMEPVEDDQYFIKDWGKVEGDKPRSWGSLFKAQVKGE